MSRIKLTKSLIKEQIFAVCDSLYKQGAKKEEDFSIRKIRALRTEMFGLGGKFEAITKHRDAWFVANGFKTGEEIANKKEISAKAEVAIAVGNTPWLHTAVEQFVNQQAEVLSTQMKLEFDKKIEALKEENNQLRSDNEKLNGYLQDKNVEIESLTQRLSDLTHLSETFKVTIESVSENKASIKEEKTKRLLAENKLEDEKKARYSLSLSYKELKEGLNAYKASNNKLEKENTKLKASLRKVEVNQDHQAKTIKIIQDQYQHALQKIKWLEEEKTQMSKDEKKRISAIIKETQQKELKIRDVFVSEAYKARIENKLAIEEIERIIASHLDSEQQKQKS